MNVQTTPEMLMAAMGERARAAARVLAAAPTAVKAKAVRAMAAALRAQAGAIAAANDVDMANATQLSPAM